MDLTRVEKIGRDLISTAKKVGAGTGELIEWRVEAANIVEGFTAIAKFVEQRATDDVKDMARQLLKRAEAVRDMVALDS